MTPEGNLKREVKAYLKGFGDRCWFFMHVPMGYGQRGVPDFTGCLDGRFFAIETKSPGGKLTPWQKKALEEIREAGGTICVAFSIEDVKKALGD